MNIRLFLLLSLLVNNPLYGMEQTSYVPKTLKEKFIQTNAHAQLFKAARKSNLKKMRQLVALPFVDVNTVDQDGNTPLHLARHPAIVALLIKNSAKLHATNLEGDTPLNCTDRNGNIVLHVISDPAMLTLLIKKGANVRTINLAGETPLHCMAKSKEESGLAIELLVNEGAMLDAVDAAGNTPLHLAAGNEYNNSAFETLLKAGARIDIKNAQSDIPSDHSNIFIQRTIYAPLIQAIESKKNNAVRSFIAQGINPNQNISPIHDKYKANFLLSVALYSCNEEAVRLLLDAGAYPNQQASGGYRRMMTPMGPHLIEVSQDSICTKTLRHGCADIARLLIAHIPKPLITKHINSTVLPFRSFLACMRRACNMPPDIRKLLFELCAAHAILDEHILTALKICEDIPWDNTAVQLPREHKDRFDVTKLAQYHSAWQEQINHAILNRP